MKTLKEIRDEAFALPREEKMELADALYSSVEPLPVDSEFGGELDNRIQEIISGNETGAALPDILKKSDAIINATTNPS